MRILSPVQKLPLSPLAPSGRPARAPEAGRASPAGDVLALSPGAVRFGGRKENQMLINAAESGDAAAVKKLVKNRSVDLDYQDNKGNTALISATWNGFPEIAQILLNNYANPNLQDKEGNTALMVATNEDHPKIVQMLLNKQANPNLQNKDGDTALTLAVAKNNSEITRMLLKKKATDPNLQNKDGDTALTLAADNGHTEITRMLIDRGANPHIQNNNEWTARELAQHQGHQQLAAMLESAEAKWNAHHGNPPSQAAPQQPQDSSAHHRPSSSASTPQHPASNHESESAPLLNAGVATSSGRRLGRAFTFQNYEEYRQSRRNARWQVSQGGLLAAGAVTTGVLAFVFSPIVAAGAVLATGGGSLIVSAVKKFLDIGSELADNPSFLNRFKRSVRNGAGSVKHWANAKLDPLRTNPKYKPNEAYASRLSDTLDRLSERFGERSYQEAIAFERRTLKLIERNVLSGRQAISKRGLYNTHEFLRKYNKYLSQLPENMGMLKEVNVLQMGEIIRRARESGIRKLVEWSRQPNSLAKRIAQQDFEPINHRLLEC